MLRKLSAAFATPMWMSVDLVQRLPRRRDFVHDGVSYSISVRQERPLDSEYTYKGPKSNACSVSFVSPGGRLVHVNGEPDFHLKYTPIWGVRDDYTWVAKQRLQLTVSVDEIEVVRGVPEFTKSTNHRLYELLTAMHKALWALAEEESQRRGRAQEAASAAAQQDRDEAERRKRERLDSL